MLLAFDIEGVGNPKILHPSQIEVLCLGLHDGSETLMIPEDQLTEPWPEMWEAMSKCLLFGHNGLFDSVVLGYNLAGVHNPLPLYSDTILDHYVIYPAARENGLKHLGGKFYGIPDWSLPDYTRMRSYSPEELHRYCATDVEVTFWLEEDLKSVILANENMTRVMNDILMPAENMLAWVNWFGFAFDVDYVTNELIPDLEENKAQALKILEITAEKIAPGVQWPKRKDPELSQPRKPVYFHRFNPGSPKQITELYQARGIHLESTDEKVMTKLAERGDGFAHNLLTYRKFDKQLGTYARKNLNHALFSKSELVLPGSVRVMPAYNLHTTVTGRLSSSDPNIQNQPRLPEFRRPFIAHRKGRVLMQADYSQAELRVMAAESGDEWLISLFDNPEVDIFDQMLPVMFPNRVPKNADEKKEMRAKLKAVVYGLAYGRQARAIAFELGMSVSEAQRIVTDFLTAAHGLADWRNDVLNRLHDGRGLQTRFGRFFQHDVITPKNKGNVERSALSFIPQSSASDCCLLAAVQLVDYIRSNDRDWQVAALVHDSITLDIPESEAEESSELTRSILIKHGENWFPEVKFKADGKSGFSWDRT